MGVLRTLLAIAVLAGHLTAGGPRFFGGGSMAVECFYILSGFYMSLVLRSKYRNDLGAFAKARFVRLAPLYWLVAGGTLAVSTLYWLLSGNPVGFWYHVTTQTYPWWAWIMGVSGNLFGFGADWLLLSSERVGRDFSGLLVIAPVWSIAVELSCYLLAPFVFRQSLRRLVLVFAASVALRLMIFSEAADASYFWTLYFMPVGLACFLLGGLAHRAFEALPAAWLEARWLCYTGRGLCAGLALLIASYSTVNTFTSRDSRFHLLFACCLPLIFSAVRSSRWDRWIGDFAYPIYLIHPVILVHWGSLRDRLPESSRFYVLTALTCGLSWVALRIVHRFERRNAPVSLPEPHGTPAAVSAPQPTSL